MPETPQDAGLAARLATRPRALPADRTLVIGIFGAAGSRRALIRHPDGTTRTLRRGDRAFGGIVAAVLEDRVRIERPSGRTEVALPDTDTLASSPRPQPRRAPPLPAATRALLKRSA